MSSQAMSAPLRLKAIDPVDLAVISSCLQDALVLVGDMAYEPQDQTFLLVANRFVWETPTENRRVTTGVTFDGVSAVKIQGIDRRQRETILSLLSVQAADSGIVLTFSGDGAVKLEMKDILVRLQDVSEAWPTLWRPKHAD
jgi:hypothetical protein